MIDEKEARIVREIYIKLAILARKMDGNSYPHLSGWRHARYWVAATYTTFSEFETLIQPLIDNGVIEVKGGVNERLEYRYKGAVPETDDPSQSSSDVSDHPV